MLKIKGSAKNYAWGRMGTESLVGRIAAKDHAITENSPYAEFWLGDHNNGACSVLVDANN